MARRVPIVTGELGEHDDRATFVTTYMRWTDRQWSRHRSVSFLAWSWDAELVDIDQDWDLDILVSCKLCAANFVFRNDYGLYEYTAYVYH